MSVLPALPAAPLAQDLPAGWLEKAQAQVISPDLRAPMDPSNRWTGNSAAIALGEKLFFDTGLSADGSVACASCHVTDGAFRPNESRPATASRGFRTVMPVQGAAFQEFFFWDGRKDSLWSQALGPLENPDEHGLTRTEVVAYLARHYPDDIAALTGQSIDPALADLPPASPTGSRTARKAWRALDDETRTQVDDLFATAGKSIAAFETDLPLPQSAWEDIVQAAATDPASVPAPVARGFYLFSGKARCSSCHNGPLFSDGDFHNTGLPQRAGQPVDMGRQAGLSDLMSDPFNCLGPNSDAKPDQCPKLTYLSLSMERALGTFRTPSLRGVAQRQVLGHGGQFTALDQMLDHYNTAPLGPHGRMVGQTTLSELIPLGLTPQELADLKAFLETL